MYMENDFNKNKYAVVRNFISREQADFLFTYLFMKRNVQITLIKEKLIPPFSEYFGTFYDDQIPNTYANYGDVAMDTLLYLNKHKVEKIMNQPLVEAYSYCRMYKKGDELKRHKDRPSCELSATLHLGGDEWPIYLEPSGQEGMKGIEVNLNPGDALFYMGCELEHWREPFKGDHCGQVFLHYTSVQNKNRLYDGRPHLGLPGHLQNMKKC